MEQTPVYRVIPSSYGVTTQSTSRGGRSGYVPPLPGLSTWNMPPLEDASPPKPATILPYRPPAGGTGCLGTPLSRPALALQAPAPQAPQMAPPICQPPPFPRGLPATPYQQAVQPPSKSARLGVTFDSSADKPSATGGQDAGGHGRLSTQG